jgi:hypothetical protein
MIWPIWKLALISSDIEASLYKIHGGMGAVFQHGDNSMLI